MRIPLLDYLTAERERIFDNNSISVDGGLLIIPSKMVSLIYKNVNWKEKLNLFAGLSKDDFLCPKALEAEPEFWEIYWLESKQRLPDNISSTLKCILFNGFKKIKVWLRILDTSPLITCTCEQPFSAMRRLKTFVRSTIVLERLNSIALIKNRRLAFT